MLVEDVIKCMFSNWHPILGHLSIESEVISVDDSFRDYLLSDGIILPKCCDSEQEDYEESQNGTEVDNENVGPEFPEIENKLRRCLRKYKNIFPKMNWSSCEDSRWIQASGTKCSNMTEVFLLLNSSDKIVHDLTEPFEHCFDYDPDNVPIVKYELVCRKWININPSMEFRCFIAKNIIIGICQRDVRSYYDYIKNDKDNIIADILEFFQGKISNKLSLDNYVIDLYRPSAESITLIDVNPFGEITDSLLFDWNELRSKAIAPPPPRFRDFRFIEDRFGIQTQRFELNSLPIDVFNGNISLNI